MRRNRDGNVRDDAGHALAVAAGNEGGDVRGHIDLEGSCERRKSAKGESGDGSDGLEGQHRKLAM